MQHKPTILSLDFINKLILTTLRLIATTHLRVYRFTGGRLGGRVYGNRVLLLTTTGRKTGRQRTTPLAYLVAGEALAIIGGAAGSEKAPDWWLNLQSHPVAEVQLGARKLRVRASEATEEQRLALWKQYPKMRARYEFMQKRMQRKIPVVILRTE